MAPRGLFITFEGGDASGKTTQSKMVAEKLGGLWTREPGGTALGGVLRSLCLDGEYDPPGLAELFLMAADRTLHVEELLKPTLASGRHVICDRYTHSTIAYQGYGRGLNLTDVTEIARIAESGLRPDLTLVIHVSAEVCAARLSSRGEKNRLEEVDEGFSTRVREAYLEQAGADGSIVVIDGSGSVAEVHEAIMSVLHTRLGLVGL